MDRIDIQIEVPRVKIEELRKSNKDSSGEKIGERIKSTVIEARKIQKERFSKIKPRLHLNSEMSSKQTEELINLSKDAENFLKNILEKSFVSARGYYRILKIARTIADLEKSEEVNGGHLAEAFQYRVREKE